MKKFISELREFLEKPFIIILSGACVLLSHIMTEFDLFSLMGIPLWCDPSLISVLLCGIPIILAALEAVKNEKGIRKISSELLVSFAMLASIALFFISEKAGEDGLFAAGEVAFIMQLGEMLEDLTGERARRGLGKLISLVPEKARLITENSEVEVDASSLKVGDIIRILPGERIPADCIIIKGETAADQSVITGESLPAEKKSGDVLYSATLNTYGAVECRVSAACEDSSVSKMISLMREADEKRAPSERTADRWAGILVPVSLLVAVITGTVVTFLSGFEEGAYRAVSIMVVFCPCALVLATPTAVMAAIGQAASHGVIIKSGEALEKMGRTDILAFDKTGTLTDGKLEVLDIFNSCPKIRSDSELLKLCASCELGSEHPIGKAVVAYAQEKGCVLSAPFRSETVPGSGIISDTEEYGKIYCGNEAWLKKCGFDADDETAEKLALWRSERFAVIVVAQEEKGITGAVALSDTLRPEAEKTVSELKKLNEKIVLLTGDHREIAEMYAAEAGIEEVRSELLPADKVRELEKLKADGHTTAMIGDGVNDAPAMRVSDLGISMAGLGSDIAAEASDIALVHDDLSRLPYLVRLSRATVGTIRFCITLSMVINVAAVILSVAGLLGPALGALVHNAGSFLVVSIAALLYGRKFD